MASKSTTQPEEISCTPCERTGRQTTPVSTPCERTGRQTTPVSADAVSGSSVEYPRTIGLGMPTDAKLPSDVSSIVRLVSGSFLVCDWSNRALKMLDGNYAVVDEVRFTDKPHTVCVFNENEVAVSLRDKKEIVFVTLEKALRISSRQPVKTKDACRGITCVNAELYVGAGGAMRGNEKPGQVEVYAISGMRIIETDAGGNRLFGSPRGFAVNPTGSEINIADFQKGVITINPRGTVLRRLSDPILQGARGMCMDDKGNLYVVGEKLQNVVKIEQNGSMKVVLSESDGVVKPRSVCFDPERRCLLVGMLAKKALVAFKINE